MKHIIYNQLIELNNNYYLNKSDSNHIKNSLRLRIGDEIIVLDISEKNYVCEIVSMSNKGVEFIPKSIMEKSYNHKKIEIELCFSLIKPNKIELVLEKCTEINVSSFQLISTNFCSYSADNINQRKYERWNKIIKEAVQQCGRDIIPPLKEVVPIKNLEIEKNSTVILLDENCNIPLLTQLEQNYINDNKIIIFTGPEGSFSEDEKQFIRSKFNALPSSISNNVLKSETASILAVGICNHFFQYKYDFKEAKNENPK